MIYVILIALALIQIGNYLAQKHVNKLVVRALEIISERLDNADIEKMKSEVDKIANIDECINTILHMNREKHGN